MKYAGRTEAGKYLAGQLQSRGYNVESIVLALPRGGVPVAYEVAHRLNLPLDVLIVRKLGYPGQEEFAMGAVASGGVVFLDKDVITRASLPRARVEEVISREQQELERREIAYREGRPRLLVTDRHIILVDDGLATGSTMRAAIQSLRQEHVKSITVAVPVGAAETCTAMAMEADKVVCAATPEPFYAVGMWYENFAQTTDDEVREYLHLAQQTDQADSSVRH